MVRLLFLAIALLAFGFESASVCLATSAINAPIIHLAVPSSHTATLLPNGKVLVTGGGDVITDSGSAVSSAELYDPASGTWEATGAMNDKRASHTATLLSNGKVLVAGGGGTVSSFGAGNPFTASAELYDPATGTWTPTGTMNSMHSAHTATLLPNGKVLIAGGYTIIVTGQSWFSAELYDPATGMWTATAPLNPWGLGHTATLLADGRVLVAGFKGGISVPGGTPNVEIYDPTTDNWTATGAMNDGRSSHTATLLPDGKVLVAGGLNAGRALLSSAELYDPMLGTWATTGATTSTRSSHTAALLADGNVLVAGGSSIAEIYNPSLGTWSRIGAPDIARSTFTSTLLPNGRILLSGDLAGDALSSTGWYQALTLHAVTSGAGANGSISLNAVQTVIDGRSVGFTASPALGYRVDQWIINGMVAQQGAVPYKGLAYTVPNVTANTTVQVTFARAVPTDFNNDGKTDLFFQNSAGQIYAWFLNGIGNTVNPATGAGLARVNYLSGSALGDWRVAAVADVNGDGNADLIFQNSTGQISAWFLDGSGNTVNPATGAGRIGPARFLYTGGLGDWRVVACADVNGDGKADLIFQNTIGQIAVWLLDGTGNTVDPVSGAGRIAVKFLYAAGLGDWRVVACADVNGDGKVDLVFQNGAGLIYAWFLDGTGNTVDPVSGAGRIAARYLCGSALGDWRIAACADMNGDGKTDLVFQNGAGLLYMWFLDGTGNTVDLATGAGRTGAQYLYGGTGLSGWRAR